jgi:hypothetical protein
MGETANTAPSSLRRDRPERRCAPRLALAEDSHVVMRGEAYSIVNASVAGLMFGPCEYDLPIGLALNLTVRLRIETGVAPFLTYEVNAVVMRSRHRYVAAKYEFARPGEEVLVRQYFARAKAQAAGRAA